MTNSPRRTADFPQHVMLTLLLATALLLIGSTALAQDWDYSGQPTRRDRAWSEVQHILAQAQSAGDRSGLGDYEGDPSMHFSPSGRFALLTEADAERGEPRFAYVGRYHRDGGWLALHIEGAAQDSATMPAEQREAYLAWIARAEPQAEMPFEELRQLRPSRKLLVVPWKDGELLLDEGSIRQRASLWDGMGSLQLYPSAWRLEGLASRDEGVLPEVEIADPHRAMLPRELRALFRPDAIRTRIAAVLETPATLKWQHHHARLTLRLDRGERDGLYPDMLLFGDPPDEHLTLKLEEVHADHALARFTLVRFAPGDPIDAPGVGIGFSTRPLDRMNCSIDPPVALRAKIVGAPIEPETLSFNEEGYAWIPLQIDHGRAQGLALEDVFRAEDPAVQGEGRVRALESDSATVLWRVFRQSAARDFTVPQPGDALVTPAWQRFEVELFGEADASGNAPLPPTERSRPTTASADAFAPFDDAPRRTL